MESSDIDLITELGELAFGTRLRRLSERLTRDVSRVYKSARVDFEVRWFPVLYLLGRESSLPVTVIARSLGLSHPAVNQITAAMARRKLISSRKDPSDERRRLVALTAKGRETITELTPIWETIADATRDLIAESETDFLTQIARLEGALDREDMYHRVTERLRTRQIEDIEIIDYAPQYKQYFKALNYEWLEQYFEIEPADEALLSDPQGKILRPGGAVLFARLNGEIVGTAALIRHDTDRYELAKMAVTPRAQGRQVGRSLALAIIERARQKGARVLMLHTNPNLKPANSLYRSLGFRTRVSDDAPRAEYQRYTITMTLDLTQAAEPAARRR